MIVATETSATMDVSESPKKLSSAKPVGNVPSGLFGDHFLLVPSLVEKVRGQEHANVSMGEKEKLDARAPPSM